MSLLYFVPRVSATDLLQDGRISPARIERPAPELAAVLCDVRTVDDCPLSELVGNGPGDQPGVILAPTSPGREPTRNLGYYKDRQAWRESPCGRYWYGRDLHADLRPEDFRRRTPLVRGYDVELASGTVWHVPMVRRPTGETNLPKSVEFATPGQLAARVQAQFMPLWESLGEICDFVWGGREKQPGDDLAWFKCAVTVLAVNYRVGLAAHNAFDLIDSETIWGVLRSAIDMPFYDDQFRAAEQKKSESAAAIASSATG